MKKSTLRPLHEFSRFDVNGVKLTKANSEIIEGRIYYIVKKDVNRKTTSMYMAYDYETGIPVYWHKKKEQLIEWLKERADLIDEKFKGIEKP